jgi:hypothetical protein
MGAHCTGAVGTVQNRLKWRRFSPALTAQGFWRIAGGGRAAAVSSESACFIEYTDCLVAPEALAVTGLKRSVVNRRRL